MSRTFIFKAAKIRTATIFLVLLYSQFIYTQDLNYAHEVVDTLCSKYMAGRGYSENGHIKAADYIENEWRKQGLKPLPGKDYQQKFNLTVNTFNEDLFLSINKKKLVVGKDFIIEPSSIGKTGKLKVNTISADNFGSDEGILKLAKAAENNKRALLIESNDTKNLSGNIRGLVEAKEPNVVLETTNQKLTWHISPMQSNTLHFIIKDEALPKNPKKIKFDVDNTYLKNEETQNIVAYIEGSEQPDSFYVFCGHYDHLGKLGKDNYIPGANDNASGIAMLLNLSKYYSENPPKYSIVFIAFGGEETGLLGSKHFTESWWMDLSKIKFLINLDIVGGGSEGIQIVNSKIFEEAYHLMDSLNNENNYLPKIKLRGKAANSDHWFFYENGVPCFFIYTLGGPPHYHDILDKAETLPLTGFVGLHKLITAFVKNY